MKTKELKIEVTLTRNLGNYENVKITQGEIIEVNSQFPSEKQQELLNKSSNALLKEITKIADEYYEDYDVTH